MSKVYLISNSHKKDDAWLDTSDDQKQQKEPIDDWKWKERN